MMNLSAILALVLVSAGAQDDDIRGSAFESQFTYIIQHCVNPPCDPLAKNAASTTSGVLGQQGFVDRGTVRYKKSKKVDDYITILSGGDIAKEDLTRLAASSADKYTIRLICDDSSACDKTRLPVFTTIPTCWLWNSNFEDNLVLHVGEDGQLLSVEYRAEGDAACSSRDVVVKDQVPRKFKSTATVVRPTSVTPLDPPMDEYGGETDSDGNPKPKVEEAGGIFGLFKRYWYIILPLVLMSLTSQPPAPAQGGQPAAGQRAPQ